MKGQWYNIECGWGMTKAKLQYIHQGVYYWKSNKGFRFISHDLEGATAI